MRPLLILMMLLAGPGLARVEPASAGLSERCIELLDSTINQAIADTVFPGAVVAVVRRDKLAYLKSFGAQAVLPEYEPMTDSTIFDLASLSKPVSTAIAVMQLVERNKIGLDSLVVKYIPEFLPYEAVEGKDTVREDITVRQLLLHTSGLPPYLGVDALVKKEGRSHKAAVKYIATEAKRKTPPGTALKYSCLNYVTLQEIVERRTNQKLCDYAAKKIFDVLEMNDTRYFPGGAPDSLLCRIAPTEMNPDSTWIRGHVHDPLAWKLGNGNSGNAGVFSTAPDLAVLCAALLNGGRLYKQEDGTLGATKTSQTRRILYPASVLAMHQRDSLSGRTLGWDSDSPQSGLKGKVFSNKDIICHTGFTGPSIVMDYRTKTAVIILCSRLHPSDRGAVKWEHAMLGDVRREISDIVAESVCQYRK